MHHGCINMNQIVFIWHGDMLIVHHVVTMQVQCKLEDHFMVVMVVCKMLSMTCGFILWMHKLCLLLMKNVLLYGLNYREYLNANHSHHMVVDHQAMDQVHQLMDHHQVHMVQDQVHMVQEEIQTH